MPGDCAAEEKTAGHAAAAAAAVEDVQLRQDVRDAAEGAQPSVVDGSVAEVKRNTLSGLWDAVAAAVGDGKQGQDDLMKLPSDTAAEDDVDAEDDGGRAAEAVSVENDSGVVASLL